MSSPLIIVIVVFLVPLAFMLIASHPSITLLGLFAPGCGKKAAALANVRQWADRFFEKPSRRVLPVGAMTGHAIRLEFEEAGDG